MKTNKLTLTVAAAIATLALGFTGCNKSTRSNSDRYNSSTPSTDQTGATTSTASTGATSSTASTNMSPSTSAPSSTASTSTSSTQ